MFAKTSRPHRQTPLSLCPPVWSVFQLLNMRLLIYIRIISIVRFIFVNCIVNSYTDRNRDFFIRLFMDIQCIRMPRLNGKRLGKRMLADCQGILDCPASRYIKIRCIFFCRSIECQTSAGIITCLYCKLVSRRRYFYIRLNRNGCIGYGTMGSRSLSCWKP